MGEAARLWIFLMPYALLFATVIIEKFHRNQSEIVRRVLPGTILVAQMVTCLLTAVQIDGFGFTEL